jgi:hypothetical protein
MQQVRPLAVGTLIALAVSCGNHRHLQYALTATAWFAHCVQNLFEQNVRSEIGVRQVIVKTLSL